MLAAVVVILANRFALLGQIFRSGQVLLYNEALYSGQPVLVIALASVEFAPFFRLSQYGTETVSPFLPRQLPSLRELKNHRESLSLPRLGKDRPLFVARKKLKFSQPVRIDHGRQLMVGLLKVMADNSLDAIVYKAVEHQPTLIEHGVNPPFVNTKGVSYLNTFLVYVPAIVVPAGSTADNLPGGYHYHGTTLR